MTRLKSRFLVDLLLRRTEAAGGFATVLAKGDDTSGIILVQCTERGRPGPLLERRFSAQGHYIWEAVGSNDPKDSESRANYQERRRKADPDLWLIELDIADAPQLVAEWAALT
ncbi:hypothetical protein ASE06_17210 [Sphingopyxis sp. Root214]|uniref:DUF1491 family protein n=1 Tax=unclassified Sphingopyxis TaxID=2614943 RepID=UPI0006F6F641|nr:MULTISPECIES: DUF1491 family protein [unclassified Sphingopyxis]KQZ74036.1 hypothetical protein ASD73_14865 [Sphingopyxis sp. Root154]KRC08176.1 hypothetical protein ASE06_17210 [Sphingopyxis sp. Root214]